MIKFFKRERKSGPFEPQRMYYQWLVFRRAGPSRPDRIIMPLIWVGTILVILFFAGWVLRYYLESKGLANAPSIFSDQWSMITVIIVCYLAAFILILLPVIFLLVDFLAQVPMAVRDDFDKGFMESIFGAPVSTRSIVADLKLWALRMNLKHILPAIAIAIALWVVLHVMIFIDDNSPEYWEVLEDAMVYVIIPMMFVAIPLWRFFLITGVACAGLPRWVTLSWACLLFWVIPVLTGVFWGGTELAEETQILYTGGRHTPIYYGSNRLQLDFMWLAAHYGILLTIATQILAPFVVKWMEGRRAGKWL